jgi:hypothetical protein
MRKLVNHLVCENAHDFFGDHYAKKMSPPSRRLSFASSLCKTPPVEGQRFTFGPLLLGRAVLCRRGRHGNDGIQRRRTVKIEKILQRMRMLVT